MIFICDYPIKPSRADGLNSCCIIADRLYHNVSMNIEMYVSWIIVSVSLKQVTFVSNKKSLAIGKCEMIIWQVQDMYKTVSNAAMLCSW